MTNFDEAEQLNYRLIIFQKGFSERKTFQGAVNKFNVVWTD